MVTNWKRNIMMGSAGLLAFAAVVSISHADTTIVDNLGDTTRAAKSLTQMGQGFTMPESGDDILSSVTLDLNFTGAASANVYLYTLSAPGSLPTGSALATLGTVSSAGAVNNYLVSLYELNYQLTLGASYAIVVDTSSTVTWNYTQDGAASGGTAADLKTPFYYNTTAWQYSNGGTYQQLSIITSSTSAQPTPEPSTLALASLGGIAGFLLFRRWSAPTPSARRRK